MIDYLSMWEFVIILGLLALCAYLAMTRHA